HHEGAYHQDLAMRAGEDAHQAVLQVQAYGHHRIDAADDQAVYGQVGNQGKVHRSIIRFCSRRPRRGQALACCSVAGREEPDRLIRAYFQAGLGATSLAVALSAGHTTSNSSPCHWLTVPGILAFSPSLKLILPNMVSNSFEAI